MTPEQVDKLITFGKMALEQGWYDQARGYFEQVLELDPANSEAMKGLARVYERLSREEAADVKPTKTRVEPIRLPNREVEISYKEDKVPLEAQAERIKAAKKSYPWLPIVVVGALLLACVLCVIVAGTHAPPTVDLHAWVLFTGTQFIIQNNDAFDWMNVELKVNSHYILETRRMQAGKTYTIGAMQFTKSNGEKFNPFTHKPLEFTIWCDTPNGNGFYYREW